jgi:succinate-semialdehyde dehydrogenase/glutarate-semialdehyde dehydrogenase
MLDLKDPTLLRTDAFIAGQWVSGPLNKTVAVLNPATESCLAQVADLGREQATEAIVAADDAMVEWSAETAKMRASILRTWFDLILSNQEDLAKILTAEQGKPIAEARNEIIYAASFLEFFAEEGKRLYGDVIPSQGRDKRLMTLKQPIGVVAAITPWNFPAAMITRKVAPALAAGCGVVVKPAAETPLTALALAELGSRAGLPNGILNVVVSTDAIGVGEVLTRNPVVKKVSFTGSTRVGKLLMAQCASTVKKTSMELGGNAPFLVFEDADLDAALEGLMVSKFRNAGQTCVCANRIMVHEDVYDTFVERLLLAVRNLKVGEGTDPCTNIGPLIDARALKRVDSLVRDAINLGARVLAGGQHSVLGGNFYEPTVLAELNDDMSISREEIFGPIAALYKFSSDSEALAMANSTSSGLASYFYTENISRIWRFSEDLQFGIVGVNEGLISTELAPFGGVKESGLGREGSKYGLDDFVEIKYVCMGGIKY